MVKQTIIGLILVVVASLCYYVPTMLASSKGIDLKTVQPEFYRHHIWRTSGAFLLTAIYAGCFFFMVPEKLLALKIFSCHLFLMESISFISHTLNMFVFKTGYSLNQIILTFLVFACCLSFFSYRALKNKTGDEFRSNKTYLVISKPKNLIGFINYLIHHIGHLSIYQDGKIYGFKKPDGTIEERSATYEFFNNDQLYLKEIPQIKNVESLIGKQYQLFRFNCNHLKRYATGT
jgi:hypothetical protein